MNTNAESCECSGDLAAVIDDFMQYLSAGKFLSAATSGCLHVGWPTASALLIAKHINKAESIAKGEVAQVGVVKSYSYSAEPLDEMIKLVESALLDDKEGRSTAVEKRLIPHVLNGLRARLAHNAMKQLGNLYMSSSSSAKTDKTESRESASETDMLEAFNLLVGSTPLVTFGYNAVNLSIIQTIINEIEARPVGIMRPILIVDIGCGSGLQWLELLKQLRDVTQHIKSVKNKLENDGVAIRFVGVDVPSDGALERLRGVGKRLQVEADRLFQGNIKVDFAPVAAFAQNIADWKSACDPADGTNLSLNHPLLVVNAAFSLHHVPNGARYELLCRLRDQLKPDIFTLVEPYAAHNEYEFFPPRTMEVIRHYGMVFEILGTLLPESSRGRTVLESEFFGREIVNILAGEGEARVERHERFEQWRQLFERAGFRPISMYGGITSAMEKYNAELRKQCAHFSVACLSESENAVSLNWKGEPLLVGSVWKTRVSGDAA